MSDEKETKKILQYRNTVESRLKEVEQEMEDLKNALTRIDGLLVNTGFRTLGSSTDPVPQQSDSSPEPINGDDELGVTGKDGTLLGSQKIDGVTLVFTPSDAFEFTTDIPPFQSFLVERVLENMRRTDQQRASNGELEPQDILEYSIETDGENLSTLTVNNYGGERRLRELSSSIRWTLDKMYDKLREG